MSEDLDGSVTGRKDNECGGGCCCSRLLSECIGQGSWRAIGCESVWRWFPTLKYRFADPEMERKYLLSAHEDFCDCFKSIGILVALIHLVWFALRLISKFDTFLIMVTRSTIFISFSLMAVLHLLLGKRLKTLYVTRLARNKATSVQERTLQYNRIEWNLTFALFFLLAGAAAFQGRWTYKEDEGFVWAMGPMRFQRYQFAPFAQTYLLFAIWLIIKCHSFETSCLILLHFVVGMGLCYWEMGFNPHMGWAFAVLCILFAVGSRQMELVSRSALFQKEQALREKEQKSRLLEGFASMIGVAAWEWDTTKRPDTCYQTKIIEVLTGRPAVYKPPPETSSTAPTTPKPASETSKGTSGSARSRWLCLSHWWPRLRKWRLMRPNKRRSPSSFLNLFKAAARTPTKEQCMPPRSSTPQLSTDAATTRDDSSLPVVCVEGQQPSSPRHSRHSDMVGIIPLRPMSEAADVNMHVPSETTTEDGCFYSCSGMIERDQNQTGYMLPAAVHQHQRRILPPSVRIFRERVAEEPCQLLVQIDREDSREGEEGFFSGFWTQFVVGSEGKTKINDAIRKCADEGRAFEVELMYERSDGKCRWFRCAGRKESDTSPIVYGFIQDVTDRRCVESRDRQLLSRYMKTTDTLLEATALIDIQEEVLIESSSLLNLWQQRVLEGVPLAQLFDRDTLRRLKAVKAEDQEPLQANVRLLRQPDRQAAECHIFAWAEDDDPALVFVGFRDFLFYGPPFEPISSGVPQPNSTPPGMPGHSDTRTLPPTEWSTEEEADAPEVVCQEEMGETDEPSLPPLAPTRLPSPMSDGYWGRERRIVVSNDSGNAGGDCMHPHEDATISVSVPELHGGAWWGEYGHGHGHGPPDVLPPSYSDGGV
ncbi:unnamed protein product [Vitrella brassicaformis CCMP3155]|uniref:PAS domain-containing protein n=3 Tax=Vitrella brassicaformis TaxID=1169539 RepID=A0A0G4ERH0_VITBC|nr:unnamed protein product [Vitrella brassicaformis CCMP3155]|eukprot:CEM00629.1 unnamed protein product [Vitrella brassicaformis CCMP3155]